MPVSARQTWYQAIARFEKRDLRKASWQVVNTLFPYILLWSVMVWCVRAGAPYWAVLLLALPAGLFAVRLFILFHDCAHQSFLSSKRSNRVCGYILGVLTFTPYEKWRASHWKHHGTVADLDRRGSGDFWTMTTSEYLESPRWKRWVYRLARQPFIVFILGPVFIFVVSQRFPISVRSKKERNSVYLADLGILGIVSVAGLTLGFRTYLIIQLPITFIGGMLGLWLFYVQHNFEGAYWARHTEWDRMKAALEGSSFYRLPKILQWFTGNIGFHHVHHVRPMIPNYHLERCWASEPALREVKPLTVRRSLRSLGLRLWNEQNKKLVSFRSLKNPET